MSAHQVPRTLAEVEELLGELRAERDHVLHALEAIVEAPPCPRRQARTRAKVKRQLQDLFHTWTGMIVAAEAVRQSWATQGGL